MSLVDSSTKKYFSTHISENVNGIYPPGSLQKNLEEYAGSNLIFIASGHGSIDGIAIDGCPIHLSPDVFEEFAQLNDQHFTFLILSQCISGAFNHLDTRHKILVMGAAEFQNSVSQPMSLMKFLSDEDHYYLSNNLCFYQGISINPFIFSFVITTVLSQSLIKRNTKSALNIYKYVSTRSLSILHDLHDVIPLPDSSGKVMFGFKLRQTQRPFLLNKILASSILF